jgi:hypothetical protein
MPTISGLPALDIAVGLAFLFFFLSTICATVAEMVAGWLGWRAQNLEMGLLNLLTHEERVKAFFNKPRIAALVESDRNKPGKRRSPSYIPARAFALAVLDTFNPDLPKTQGDSAPTADAIESARRLAGDLPGPVRQAVLDALDEGRASIDEIRHEVETTFDHVMDRAAGWYKRRTQKFLLVFATVLTLALNISAFHVADRLAKDDALRAAVVQRAAQASDKQPATGADFTEVAKQIDGVKQLGLPIGWAKVNRPTDLWSGLGRVAGWLATILGITLGAPFWFDVLGKFSRLRNSGKPEETPKDKAPG